MSIATKLDRDNWAANTEAWSAAEYIEGFADRTRMHVRSHWAYLRRYKPLATVDELEGAALESLVRYAPGFLEWCETSGEDPTSKALFWHGLRVRIDWDLEKVVQRKLTSADSIEDYAGLDGRPAKRDWIRTEMARYRAPSMLHHSVVEEIERLRTDHQVALALYYFEQLPQDAIAGLLNVTRRGAGSKVGRAASRVLEVAQGLVGSSSPARRFGSRKPYLATSALTTWLAAHYGIEDPSVYCRYVAAHYRVDVRYVVEILDRGHGNRINNSRMCASDHG